jgi:hypothetical protein
MLDRGEHGHPFVGAMPSSRHVVNSAVAASRDGACGNAYAEDVAVDSVVARLRAIPEYRTLFAEVYGEDEAIDEDRLGRAIAAFERSLVAMDAPLDRFRAGDSTAMTAEQIRGMNAFDDAGERCHDGTMFTDFDLEVEGVAEHAFLAEPDTGAGRFRFRTPSLRNVAVTSPYMHNGTLATLEDVLRFYDEGRSRIRSHDPRASAERASARGSHPLSPPALNARRPRKSGVARRTSCGSRYAAPARRRRAATRWGSRIGIQPVAPLAGRGAPGSHQAAAGWTAGTFNTASENAIGIMPSARK